MSGGLLESIFGMGGKIIEAKQNKASTKRNNRARMEAAEKLPYEPMYASEQVPTYQRSQSPVARAYLESFLMGNNPDATFSGSPNAQFVKPQQQAAQDKMFGTPQQRIQQQRAMEQATPWAVQTPTRDIRGKDKGAELRYAMEHAAPSAFGVRQDVNEALRKRGYNTDLLGLEKGDESGRKVASAINGAYDAGDFGALNQILKPKVKHNRPFYNKRMRKRANHVIDVYSDRYDSSQDDEEG